MIFSKGFGLKHKNKPDVPDGSTIFRIGSVSKVFAVSSLASGMWQLIVQKGSRILTVLRKIDWQP